MELLYILENLRTPVLDACMLLITRLGEETAFLVAAMIVFWCVDKQKGYYMLSVGFLGTLTNQLLKLTFRVPRPWVLDPGFTIVEQAREAAAGFSFPSGHSTAAVGTFGSIGHVTKNKLLKNLCWIVCVLVPFSRMYLGVHTPADVLVGSIISIVLIVLLDSMVHHPGENTVKNMFAVCLGISLVLILFARFFPFSIEADQLHNLESGRKNGYTMLGAAAGLLIAYPLERRYVKFETKAVWWAQILKVLFGLALVLAVKEGLRAPLEVLFRGHLVARAVRYGFIVIVAGLVWPMSFRWFSKIGVRK